MVLEAAEGWGREISPVSSIQPRTLSACARSLCRERLDGPCIYGAQTDRCIRALLDQPPPKGSPALELVEPRSPR
jgi:hypothetical protein